MIKGGLEENRCSFVRLFRHTLECPIIIFFMTAIFNLGNYAKKLARVCGTVVYLGCIGHCASEYIGDFVICVGPSMEPTIYSGHVVFAEHLSIHRHKVKRGDIVVTLSPTNPAQHVCKRVKALAGDKVRCGLFSQTVPKGHVWLEGDNKYNSADSRTYGPVPQGLIKGRVVCRVWPLTSMKILLDT